MPEDPRVTIVYPPGNTTRTIEDSLRAEGIRAVVAGNVFKAVSAFTADPTDLVLLGLGDLDVRDLEVIQVMRELRPDVYIVALFPADRREAAVRALTSGADAYILEPFYVEELLAVVRRGLSRSGGARVPDSGEGLERLAGGVAHTINNALQIIELLLADGEEAGPGPSVTDLRRETSRIHEVVGELLAFARRGEHRPDRVDLNGLIQDRIPARERKKRKIKLNLASELPEIRGDEKALAFALDSILGIQAAGDGPQRLELTTYLREIRGRTQVCLDVSAPDLTMSEEECGALFLPFTGPLAGAVGLAGVTLQSVIHAHEGAITVESGAADGTVLGVRLPTGPPTRVREEETGNLKESDG